MPRIRVTLSFTACIRSPPANTYKKKPIRKDADVRAACRLGSRQANNKSHLQSEAKRAASPRVQNFQDTKRHSKKKIIIIITRGRIASSKCNVLLRHAQQSLLFLIDGNSPQLPRPFRALAASFFARLKTFGRRMNHQRCDDWND